METHEREDPICQVFEWTKGELASTAVVYAIADVSGEEPDEMEPLYTAIDPDALDALFAPAGASTVRPTGSIEFFVNGYRVRVTAAGEGQVFERKRDSET